MRVAIETCRARLVMVAAVFALVFLVVALRLLTMPLLSGGPAEVHAGRVRPAGRRRRRRRGPTSSTATASCWRRRSSTPSLYADTRQIPDAREATRAILSVLPQLNEADVYAQADLGQELCLDQAAPDADAAISGQSPRHSGSAIRSTRSAAFIRTAIWPRMSSGSAASTTTVWPASSGRSTSTVKSSAEPLQLSLDARVQFIVHEELAKVISDFSAKGGAGIVMDVNTGEIIAMVSLPDFDPNHPGRVDPKLSPADAKDRIFNKITLGVYELGSVFKTFNTAMALDAGVATMTKQYDASHDIKIGRFTITDYHGKHRWLSVPEIYMYSSNHRLGPDGAGGRGRAAAQLPRPSRSAEAGADRVRRGRQAAFPEQDGARST